MKNFYINKEYYPNLDTDNVPQLEQYIEEKASELEKDINRGRFSKIALNTVSKSPKESFKIVSEFLKKTGRKIYGGTALNMYLPEKHAVYDRKDFPDFDFFSTDPWGDAIHITDKLFKAGYIYSESKAGLHKNTFRVFANFWPVADITFLPEHLYEKVPTQKKKGYAIISPAYLQMTLYNIISKPIEAPYRWPKVAMRQKLLDKWAPAKYRTKNCTNDFILKSDSVTPNPELQSALEIVYNFAKKKKLIHYGSLAYNKYLEIGDAEYRIPVNFYEILTNDLDNDIKLLESEFKKRGIILVTEVEYQAFKDMNNMSTISFIKINEEFIPICIMTGLTRCIPIKIIDNRYFCSIDYLKYELYSQMFFEESNVHSYNVSCLIRYLDFIQYNYYAKNNITEIDDSPFQRFVTKCKGPFVDTMRQEFYSRWLEKAEQKAKIIDILPTNDDLVLKGIKGKKIRVYPVDFTEPSECKGRSKDRCSYPCNWIAELEKCGGIPLTGYQPGQNQPVKISSEILDIKNI